MTGQDKATRGRQRLLTLGGILLLCASVIAAPLSAAALPNDGPTRSYDGETVGTAPTGCASVGAVSVQPAAFGGAATTNRALRITDNSTTVHSRSLCDYDDSTAKSVTFDFSAAQFDTGTLLAIMGAPGGSTNGVWRFYVKPTGIAGGATVQSFDGAAWQTIGHVADIGTAGKWTKVAIDATLTEAAITIGGVQLRTAVKASTSTALSDVFFGSGGTPTVGVDFYVDNLTVASTAALPGDGLPRTFDGETVGTAPAGCTNSGAVSVQPAAFGGASATNRALRITDNSTTVHTRSLCDYGDSSAKSVSFDFSAAQFDTGVLLAIMGAPGGDANGVWRFSIKPTGTAGGAIIQSYNGSVWQTIGYVAGLGTAGQWSTVKIDATLTEAVITIGAVRMKTTVKVSTSTALSDVFIGSSGTSTVGVDFYVDNLSVTSSSPAGIVAGIVVEPILDSSLAVTGKPFVNKPIARFKPTAGTTIANYSAQALWPDGTAAASITGPDSAGYLTVTGSYTFASAGSAIAGALVADSLGRVTQGVRDVTVSQFTQVLMATAPVGTQIRFPDVITLADGRLFVVYQEANGHTGSNGIIRSVTSSDDGLTWSTPATVADIDFDARDPKIVQLSDGTLIVNYFVINWTAPATVNGTFTVRSTDGGASWSSPAPVATQMYCSCGPTVGYPLGWAGSHGAIVELANGDLLIPLYGTLSTDSRQRATVVRSTDGGLTWDSANEITLGVGSIGYQEPVLSVLPSGEIVAFIRTTSSPVRGYLARSTDNGFTWTAPVTTDIPAQSHHLLLTSSGGMFVTFGDVNRTGRATSGILLDNPSASWGGHTAGLVPLYDSGNGDQGNPSSAEVSPGKFITLGYDVTTRTLWGVFSDAGDYN